jgi:hypothetical protein
VLKSSINLRGYFVGLTDEAGWIAGEMERRRPAGVFCVPTTECRRTAGNFCVPTMERRHLAGFFCIPA